MTNTLDKSSMQERKLATFVRGSGNALLLLADEIKHNGFNKDSEKLLSEIGSKLLFEAKAFTFRKD